jgi:hypothetical protein
MVHDKLDLAWALAGALTDGDKVGFLNIEDWSPDEGTRIVGYHYEKAHTGSFDKQPPSLAHITAVRTSLLLQRVVNKT